MTAERTPGVGVVHRPLVSVVMIFKDAAPFLQEAAQSVLAQTYAPVELLLVDDGGTDGSEVLAAQAASAAPDRVRVLVHPGRENRGTGPARALGIAQARGELTAFLDADDCWDPGHLEHEVALLQAHPEAGMVCGRPWRWSSWAGGGRRDWLTPLAFAPGVVVQPPRLLAAVLRQGILTTATCSLLVRTKVLRESGGPVAAFTGMHEDQVLNSRLQLRVPAVMSGGTTSWYRQHRGSATATATRDRGYQSVMVNASRRRFLGWLDGLPELERGRADPDLRGSLDAALAGQASLEGGGRVPVARAVRGAVRRVVSGGVRRRVGAWSRGRALVRARVGSLSFVTPVSRQFGFDRGLPVDRFYVEDFLGLWAEDVRGRVLEVGDSGYTRRFGGARVSAAQVLNVFEGVPGTTFVADLAQGVGLPDAAFDCVVLTQTLHLVFDVQAAVRTLFRIVKPGGVVLVTVPGISPVSADVWADTWHWSFTRHSASRVFREVFGEHAVQVEQYGNVASATAFLHGLAAQELSARVLSASDPQFPVIVTVRAVRPA